MEYRLQRRLTVLDLLGQSHLCNDFPMPKTARARKKNDMEAAVVAAAIKEA